MTKEAILHKHVKFWNHKGEVAIDGIDTITPESAIYRAIGEYAEQESQPFKDGYVERNNEVNRLKLLLETMVKGYAAEIIASSTQENINSYWEQFKIKNGI